MDSSTSNHRLWYLFVIIFWLSYLAWVILISKYMKYVCILGIGRWYTVHSWDKPQLHGVSMVSCNKWKILAAKHTIRQILPSNWHWGSFQELLVEGMKSICSLMDHITSHYNHITITLWSHYITWYHIIITLYHIIITWYHITSHIKSHYNHIIITLYHIIITLHHIISHYNHIISHDITLHHIIITLYHIISHYITLHHITSHYNHIIITL